MSDSANPDTWESKGENLAPEQRFLSPYTVENDEDLDKQKKQNVFEARLQDLRNTKELFEKKVKELNDDIANVEEFLRILIVKENGNYWSWNGDLLSRYQGQGLFVYSVGYRLITDTDFEWHYTALPNRIITHTKGTDIDTLKIVCERADEIMRNALDQLN